MGFSIKALDNFRNASFKDADAIVNIGNDNTVSKKGSYHGAVGRMFRVSSTKAANNAARTELLCSLGNAFGLNGMGQNKDGVTTFSKSFMDKLQKLLATSSNAMTSEFPTMAPSLPASSLRSAVCPPS